jgi:hypothetical protein
MEQNVKRKHKLLKKAFLFVMMIVFGLSALSATEANVSFNIRFFDRRVYYLEQDPILIQITLTNNGPSPFRFKLADERVFSVDFDVRTNSNRTVEAADLLVRRRSRSQQVFFREVSIAAGESFSFVEDLRDYAAFSQSGAFVVQARLFPELYQSAASFGADLRFEEAGGISPGRVLAAAGRPLESNRLTLSIRPRPTIGPDNIPLALDVDTNAVLVRERLPPDEVVAYLLTARQRSQWERFFLYLDLEAMLSRDAYRRRQFNSESEEGRQRMIARYRQDLQSAVIDEDISMIPINFIIERTVYTAQTGTVTTLQFYRVGTFTERKRFTWHLERRDDIWTIVDYSVVNLGTE